MRPVIYEGVQYDADNLPEHVDAKKAVPAEKWFARNRNAEPAKRDPIPAELPDPQAAPVPNDTDPAKAAKPEGSEAKVEAPAKNGSLEAWQEFARGKGATDADLDGKSRDDLVAAYGG